jgi:hypothetical protein
MLLPLAQPHGTVADKFAAVIATDHECLEKLRERFVFREQFSENDSVLDGLGCALAEMRSGGVGRVADEENAGDQENTLSFAESEDKFTGSQTSAFGTNDVLNGIISGNSISWMIEMTSPFAMTLEFKGEVEGNAISGVVKAGAFGESRFSGARA